METISAKNLDLRVVHLWRSSIQINKPSLDYEFRPAVPSAELAEFRKGSDSEAASEA
jgi:hypothetical protein